MKLIYTLILISLSCHAQSQNLVTQFLFEQNSLNNVNNLHHLTTFGSVTPYAYENSSAEGAGCIHFKDGQGLITQDSIDLTNWNAIAISFWIKDSVNSSQYGTIALCSGFGAYLTGGTGTIRVAFDGSYAGGLITTDQINDGNWHHVVAQNNGDSTFLYIDGVLDTSQTENLLKTANKLYLGAHSNNASTHNGNFYLDDFRIYDNILSQNQINQLQQFTNIRKETTPKQNVSIYPNPVQSYLSIVMEQQVIESIAIINLSGKIVFQNKETFKNIDVNNLMSGVYFLRIKTKDGIINRKFIKE